MNRIRFLAVLLLCSGCSAIKETKLWAPEWFDMEPIATRVFVDKEMPSAQ